MNWPAQVWHVVRKDLRYARWPLVAYMAALIGLVLTFGGWPRLNASEAVTFSVLLLPFAMLLVAVLVQADAPARVDSFFATRPLAPTAMAAGKLADVAGAILLPTLVAIAVVARAYRIEWSLIATWLGGSAARLGIFLSVALVVAAVTRRLSTFVAATAGMGVALIALLVLRGQVDVVSSSDRLGWLAMTVQIGAPLAVVVAAYRNGLTLGVKGLAGVALIVWAYLMTFDFHPAAGGSVEYAVRPATEARLYRIPERTGPDGSAPIPVIGAAPVDNERFSSPLSTRVEYRVSTAAPLPTDRTLLVRPWVTVHSDRFSPEFESSGPSVMTLRDASAAPEGYRFIVADERPIPDGVGPAADSARSRAATPWQFVTLNERERKGLSGPGVHGSIRVEGYEVVQHPTISALVPLRRGARATVVGARVAFDSLWVKRDDGASVVASVNVLVTMGAVSDDRTPDYRTRFGPSARAREWALVNPVRHEMVRVAKGDGSGSQPGWPVPESTLRLDRATFVARSWGDPNPVWASEAWLRDAQLAVIDWSPVSSRPVAIRIDASLLDWKSVEPKRP